MARLESDSLVSTLIGLSELYLYWLVGLAIQTITRIETEERGRVYCVESGHH